MRATWLVTALFAFAGQACRAQQAPCPPGYPCPPAVVYRGPAAPAVVQVPVHHMKDCKGQDFVHQDPDILARFIRERDARIKATEAAEASKKAENFGLKLDGIKAQAGGTLDTNDRAFGERIMNPPPAHEEVPIPDPPAPETADDYRVPAVIALAVLFLILIAGRSKK